MSGVTEVVQASRPAAGLQQVAASMKYPLTPEEYISGRLDDQIRWYSRKSSMNQSRYKYLQTAAIVFSSAIPLIVGMWGKVFTGQLVVGVLSFLVAVIMGINALYKSHENWIAFRSTAESLRHHKLLYLTQTSPYSDANDAFHLLVKNVEALISKENSDWGRQMMSAGTQAKPEEASS